VHEDLTGRSTYRKLILAAMAFAFAATSTAACITWHKEGQETIRHAWNGFTSIFESNAVAAIVPASPLVTVRLIKSGDLVKVPGNDQFSEEVTGGLDNCFEFRKDNLVSTFFGDQENRSPVVTGAVLKWRGPYPSVVEIVRVWPMPLRGCAA